MPWHPLVRGPFGQGGPWHGRPSWCGSFQAGRSHFRKESPLGRSRFKEAGFFEQEVTFGIRPLERGPFGRGLF